MKSRLFGSSGIRGIANEEITTNLAQRIGQALATMHPGDTIVIGRDVRTTGKMLESALCGGIVSGGSDTLKIGLVPSPLTAWMVKEYGSKGGVEITASHNPAEYNGFKVFNKDGMSFTLNEREIMENLLQMESYELVSWDNLGIQKEFDAINPYIDNLIKRINIKKKWKISLDLFCGAACSVAPKVFSELDLDTVMINASPDGRFPAGNPEPNKKSLRRLGKFMKDVGSEIGFGFDGDADRMLPVNTGSQMVSPDRVLAAFAGHIVQRNGGGVIVTHVGASMNIDKMVKKAGGKVVRTPVGDAYIAEAIVEHNALFGGEPVGAWIHPDIHMCPDGILSALKLIEALEATEMNLTEFVSQVPQYPIDRAMIECPNKYKKKLIDSVSKNFQNNFRNVEHVSKIDGIRLELEKGWILIRPSGTEPFIRITVECKTIEDLNVLMEKSKNLVKNLLRKIK
jgi:phosphoglucosamine mutase